MSIERKRLIAPRNPDTGYMIKGYIEGCGRENY
jgi:hypothetical protein